MVHAFTCAGVLPSLYDRMCQFSVIGNPPVEESKPSSRACVSSHRLWDMDNYRTIGDSLW